MPCLSVLCLSIVPSALAAISTVPNPEPMERLSVKIRGKARLIEKIMAHAEDPREVIILAGLVNRSIASGALPLHLEEAAFLSRAFSHFANKLNDEAIEAQNKIVTPPGLVGPDGQAL